MQAIVNKREAYIENYNKVQALVKRESNIHQQYVEKLGK